MRMISGQGTIYQFKILNGPIENIHFNVLSFYSDITIEVFKRK